MKRAAKGGPSAIRVRGSARSRRGWGAVAVVAALIAGTSSCLVDNRYAPLPSAVSVGASDLHGTWRGRGGSALTLRPDGVAELARLDGQEFAFDDGWRMTATGTWSLSGPGRERFRNLVNDGPVVRVRVRPSPNATPSSSVTPSPSVEWPPPFSPPPTGAAQRTAPAPAEASWDLSVTKGEKGQLALFFLTSDPDLRDTYYLYKS
ncbi:hypothetical protein [Streptomyces sp. x-80]|uniref:hypothetical protein n=1 Tax=Streptomyces sp. x-80 TaxID=2789282 RepID=UPI00398101DB